MTTPSSTRRPRQPRPSANSTADAQARPELADDPFLVDLDALSALLTETALRQAMVLFKKHYVTEVYVDGPRGGDPVLHGEVAGEISDSHVSIGLDGLGALHATCTCGAFDNGRLCEHAAATLLAHGDAPRTSSLKSLTASQAALQLRVQAGQREVAVQHLAGAPAFGTWSAKSVLSTAAALRPYTVQIRHPKEPLNTCTCPDFAVNRLGTCKHIEAVLHRLRRRGAKSTAAAMAVVWLDWQAPQAPAVRVRDMGQLPPAVSALVARHFDEAGVLRGSLPDAWYALERAALRLAAEDSDTLSLGEDARAWTQRCAEQDARQARRAKVEAELQTCQGQPTWLRAKLFPYQRKGVALLAGQGRALLADDMGLGKTLQAIAAAQWLVEHEGVRRVLIVCPASLKSGWRKEIAKFTGQAAVDIQGTRVQRQALLRSDATFYVVHYEQVQRDQSLLAGEFAPDLLIVDEAQRIKNWNTQISAKVKSIPSRFVFVLTGTPLENRLADLYSLMQLVDPHVLGPLWRFEVDYCVQDERGKLAGYRNLTVLRRRLSEVMLRRSRAVIADQLPERLQIVREVSMTPVQMGIHDAAMASAGQFAQYAEKRPLSPPEEKLLLAALQTARMACDAAGLVDKKTVGSPKLEELGKILEEVAVESGRKVVVFSQWEQMTAMAEQVARDLGLGTVRLHGGVAVKNRGALIEKFEQDPATQVFLSTDAGGTGLNLQCANVLINLDLPFNPAVLEQRLARIHRLGQKQNVLIVLLVAAASYELQVGRAMSGKQHLFNQVMADDGDDVVGLSQAALKQAMQAVRELEQERKKQPLQLEGPEGEGELAPAAEEPQAGVQIDGDQADSGAVDQPAEPQLADQAPAGEPEPVEETLALQEDPVAGLVSQLSVRLGQRLERVLLARAGLLALVDRSDADDAALMAELTQADAPVVILDVQTYALLQQMGQLVGTPSESPLYLRPQAPAVSPLLTQARRKVSAARALLDQEMPDEALTLLCHALVLALTVRAGLDGVPATPAVAWIYADLLPRGLVTVEEANLAARAHGLASAPAVPQGLVEQALSEVQAVVG